MAVAFGREARMHKRAQRPRSAMDGPQRTRRTALDEQYEYLANQLTKQRVLDREGAAGSHLDDLADIHEFILRAEHAGRDAMANAIARRQVLTDVHGAQIEKQIGVHRSQRQPTASRSRRPVSGSHSALPRRAPEQTKPGRSAPAPAPTGEDSRAAPEWMPPLPPGRPPPAAQPPPVACWREASAPGQARARAHSPAEPAGLSRRPATAGALTTGTLSRASEPRPRFAPGNPDPEPNPSASPSPSQAGVANCHNSSMYCARLQVHRGGVRVSSPSPNPNPKP